MPVWTVDDLLSRVKRKCLVPSVNPKMTDAQIVEVIDEAVQAEVYPAALRPRDETMTDRATITIAADPTGESNFVILPDYLSSSTIVAVFAQQANPGGSPAYTRYPLSRLSPMVTQTASIGGDAPVAYSLMGQRLSVFPVPAQGATLVLLYERRPGRLTLTTGGRAAEMTAWDPGTSTATLSVVDFDPVAGDSVDIISASPGFFCYGYDLTIASVAGADYTLTVAAPTVSADLDAFTAPAWMVEHGYSCVWQLPDVFYQAAVYAGASAYCAETGDLVQSQANAAKLGKLLEDAVRMTTNRARLQPPVAVNYRSPLRVGGLRGRGRGWA
jgi:hypothetical protein